MSGSRYGKGQTFAIIGHRGTLPKRSVRKRRGAHRRLLSCAEGPNTLPWQPKRSAYQQAVLASTGAASREDLRMVISGLAGASFRVPAWAYFFIVKYLKKNDPMLFTSAGTPNLEWSDPEDYCDKMRPRGIGIRVREHSADPHMNSFNAVTRHSFPNTSWETTSGP